jgi:hypothetical protein
VTAVVLGTQSNVVETLSPGTVSQSGGLWSFTVRLAETAGVGTQITGMKINGVDYSSSIKGFFGSDHLAANGAMEAPLEAPGTFTPGLQFFEFWGTDDLSGQHWYRVATVTLL